MASPVPAAQRLGPNSANLFHKSSNMAHMARPDVCLDDKDEMTGGRNSSSSTPDEDPLCIIGLGGIGSPSALWDFLSRNKSAQGRVPSHRFNINGFYHANPAHSGSMDSDGGYFVSHDVRLFDNRFFGINSLEATYMDPRQRQLLEVVYECLENAGVSMDQLSGTNTGVFVGNFTLDYQIMQSRDPEYASRYTAAGEANSILANRISYIFNLHGPSCALDTACSASLYALHLARRAIQAGDCDGAIVAGVNLILSPEQHLGTMKAGVLSSTSTCHTFDASADGYGRADAINAVYLKRISSAVKNGDKIWAVIRGSAVNANGKTSGLSQPSATLQESVIRKAYADAQLHFGETDYVECHGTGTAVGDPTEIDAVHACFARSNDEPPLIIGSVKSNLGHSEAASGLTSVIKMALAFEMGEIPASHGIERVNPKLHLGKRNLRVVTGLHEKWPRELRRASVNSFGFGGASAHLIMESPSSFFGPRLSNSRPTNREQLFVLPVSAGSKRSLEVRMEQISKRAQSCDEASLCQLAYTLSLRCSQLEFKQFILAGNDGREPTTVWPVFGDQLSPNNPPNVLPVAFVFTGQGSQYPKMASELLHCNATFSSTIDEIDETLQKLPLRLAPEWTLRQAILDADEVSLVNNVERSQPLCTAVQIALANVLASWGIRPESVIGHSSGEIAAAYAAGLLTSAQAIIIAYLRGYAVAQLKRPGLMIAVGLTEEAATSIIADKGFLNQACVACINSSRSVTLSGSVDAIEYLEADLQRQGIFNRRLKTGGQAYHSYMMKDIGPLYHQLLVQCLGDSKINPKHTANMYSSVAGNGGKLGAFRDISEMAKYWQSNLESSVHFSSAVECLLADGNCHMIEVGPHGALKGPVKQIQKDFDKTERQLQYSPTLDMTRDSNLCMQSLAGILFLRGHKLNWHSVNNLPRANLAHMHDLPSYPWDYSAGILWYEPRASIDLRNRKHVRHELLGSRQLADDGIHIRWRNVLQLTEMPWLSGHKIKDRVVFPATGYLAIAMEAISQVLGIRDDLESITAEDSIVFELRDVNFRAALVVPDDDDRSTGSTELHTTMTQRVISPSAMSTQWYDFSISSWISNNSTIHCVGGIRVNKSSAGVIGTVLIPDQDKLEAFNASHWYERERRRGFNYDESYQCLTTLRMDPARNRLESICTTKMSPPGAAHPHSTFYPMHPITMDACLQAAGMGCTAGDISKLKGYLPVHISEGFIRAIGRNEADWEANIHTRAAETGFATRRLDATLRDSQLRPFIDLKGVRMSHYSDINTDEHQENQLRHPCLLMHSKPDIMRVYPANNTQIDAYISQSAIDEQDRLSGQNTICTLLDLAGHKTPDMEVLELCTHSQAEKWLPILDHGESFPRLRSWSCGAVSKTGAVEISNDEKGLFDVILIPEVLPLLIYELVHTRLANVFAQYEMSQYFFAQCLDQLPSLLKTSGIIIGRATDTSISRLRTAQFEVVELRDSVILAKPVTPVFPHASDRDVVILCHNPSPATIELAKSLSTDISHRARSVSTLSLAQLAQVGLHPTTVCISFLEVGNEFLASMSQEQMDSLRLMTNTVTDLLWVTGSDSQSSSLPNLTMAHGMSRALMLEHPSLRFSILDIGAVSDVSHQSVILGVASVLAPISDKDDKEFTLREGLLYIDRFGPDTAKNAMFQRRLQLQPNLKQVSLKDSRLARLSIGTVGVTDTIHFQQIVETHEPIPEDFVEIEVRAVGLDAEDTHSMNGRVETRHSTTSCELTGIVVSVGAAVDNVLQGDRVVVLAPHRFETVTRVPAYAVHKLLRHEEYTVMASLPTVYATALLALQDKANLRAGESVLIHSGAGALGLAAISIARRLGGIVYTTVESAAAREYLIKEAGISDAHILTSRDMSFVQGIRDMTNGHGIDVVLNSGIGDLTDASWDCVADFGRFVEIGKRDVRDAGNLSMRVFPRNVSFIALDICEFSYHKDKYYSGILNRKINQALELYRAGEILPIPLKIFDVADTAQAYRHCVEKDCIGKAVVSLERRESSIPLAPSKYLSLFSPDKVYLLIGCLGGLGRSLSRWMMARGAKRFCFLGRSGCDKPSAQLLVDRLRCSGAKVTIVRGDVTQMDDVVASINACKNHGVPIGGVVQAAMGLQEGLFSQMTSSAWHVAVQPKWAGTWNLHRALEGHDKAMDFFLMTSSLSGASGTATESNYCAANSFLDAFASWRQSINKPAVSVGLGMISEVGYLHENPEIEELLLRRGISPLSEEDFLQVIDLVLSGTEVVDKCVQTSPSNAYILTGLEPFQYRKLAAKGFDVSPQVIQDPRFSIVSATVAADRRSTTGNDRYSTQLAPHAAAPWLKSLPSHAVNSLAPQASASSLHEAVLNLAKKRFSSLILMPVDQIDENKPLAHFGVDSMIASEQRTWFWTTFKVDVTFLDLLSASNSLSGLAEMVIKKLEEEVTMGRD